MTQEMLISDRQASILRAVDEFIKNRGFSPSFDEIGEVVGTTKASVKDVLDALRRHGMIDWVSGKSRTITLTERGKRWLFVHHSPPL